MNQNFYIPDEKKDLLEKVQEVSDEDSLSASIVEALEDYIDTKLTLEEDMEKHTLDVPVFDSGETVIGKKKVRFIGRFLKEAEMFFDDTKLILRIYQGKKGHFLLYWISIGENSEGGYQTFDSLEEIENNVDIAGFPEEAKDSLREIAQEAKVTLRENKADVEIVDI